MKIVSCLFLVCFLFVDDFFSSSPIPPEDGIIKTRVVLTVFSSVFFVKAPELEDTVAAVFSALSLPAVYSTLVYRCNYPSSDLRWGDVR